MKSCKFRVSALFILVITSLSATQPVSAAQPGSAAGKELFQPKKVKSTSGVVYTLFPQGKLYFDFVVSRPSEKRADIYLCIPAAFTTSENKVDGVYISKGVIGESHSANQELGGAMVIRGGKGQLLSTDKGKLLSEKMLDSVRSSKGSLFQQFLIVHDCKPASFRDKSKFQRRAVFQTTKNAFGVVESDRPISFDVFNKDLVELGMKEALYCDMGAWDEGWYREASNHDVVRIGLDRSLTNRQSNWLLLKTAP
ncbi:MAG: hypothetical protein JST44_23825 [Cyanobacteria bacterium SZAS LIN-5]|nr:hypothetical protein [Cyanobacteria bacterium SZAS LIN-5]